MVTKMKPKNSLLSVFLMLSYLSLASVSHAQEVGEPVMGLSDLVGARAGQAENELGQRGYQIKL
jgi:hypothetical protein